MRFDGYYILSDLLDIPNLATRATQHLRHLVERYAFGYGKSESPAASRSEAGWLTVFGTASGLYKLVVFTTILLVIADRFLLLGIIMAAVCAVAWVITPLLRVMHYLAADPRLERNRLPRGGGFRGGRGGRGGAPRRGAGAQRVSGAPASSRPRCKGTL